MTSAMYLLESKNSQEELKNQTPQNTSDICGFSRAGIGIFDIMTSDVMHM